MAYESSKDIEVRRLATYEVDGVERRLSIMQYDGGDYKFRLATVGERLAQVFRISIAEAKSLSDELMMINLEDEIYDIESEIENAEHGEE